MTLLPLLIRSITITATMFAVSFNWDQLLWRATALLDVSKQGLDLNRKGTLITNLYETSIDDTANSI